MPFFFLQEKNVRNSKYSVYSHGAITWPSGWPRAVCWMSRCPGDAFKTLQAQINVEERKKHAHPKPFPHKAISYLWAVVITSHVDSIFYSFQNLSLITTLLNPFPLSSFVPINYPCIFLLPDQEGAYSEALQLHSHVGSLINHLLKCSSFVLKNM